MDCLACVLTTNAQCDDCYKFLCTVHSIILDIPYPSYTDSDTYSSYEVIVCESCRDKHRRY